MPETRIPIREVGYINPVTSVEIPEHEMEELEQYGQVSGLTLNISFQA